MLDQHDTTEHDEARCRTEISNFRCTIRSISGQLQ